MSPFKGAAPSASPSTGTGSDLADQAVFRGLRYIRLLNEEGVRPTATQVNKFAASAAPREERWEFGWESMVGQLVRTAMSVRQPAESTTDFLVRMEWAAGDAQAGLELTELGRAFLRGVIREAKEINSDDSVPSVVTLEAGNPLSLVELTQAVQEAGEGLLVDPYFRAEQLQWLITSSSIIRVLIKEPKGGTSALAVALGHFAGAERIDLRVVGGNELHDRAVVRADDGVTLIGTSVNGVGKHLTTLVRLKPEDSSSLRDRLNQLFEGAVRVEPVRVGPAATANDGTASAIDLASTPGEPA